MNVKLNKEFRMSEEDIAIVKAWPDNMPDVHLTQKQKDEVNSIYREYIKTPNDGYDGNLFWKTESKERWAGGANVRKWQAQRMLIGTLMEANRRGTLTLKDAVRLFYSALTHRAPHGRLIQLMYERI